MTLNCDSCGAENPASHKFCGQCGIALNATATATPVSDARPLLDGERRHLTVLFCDIAGSTEIAGRLDPEEWGEISSAYHRATAAAVEAFGGYVAKYLGDGVVVYFGYPAARDNDVERSVRASIEILESIKSLNRQFSDQGRPPLSVRIGIHTGSVVVSEGAGGPAEIFGDVPNIASRLQAMAAPETAEAYRRARELGGKAADPAMLWMIVLGLWTAAANSSEWRSAQALAAQLLEAADADGTNRARAWAHFATGYTAEIQGDLAAAREHIERAVAIHKSRDLDEPAPDPPRWRKLRSAGRMKSPMRPRQQYSGRSRTGGVGEQSSWPRMVSRLARRDADSRRRSHLRVEKSRIGHGNRCGRTPVSTLSAFASRRSALRQSTY
jgi:class 3 adenylate cyclase